MSKRNQKLARNAAWQVAKTQGRLRFGRLPVGGRHKSKRTRKLAQQDARERLDAWDRRDRRGDAAGLEW